MADPTAGPWKRVLVVFALPGIVATRAFVRAAGKIPVKKQVA